jgi:hypothetical protein
MPGRNEPLALQRQAREFYEALQANALKPVLPEEQIIRLKEMAAAHEKDIRALHAELERAADQ